MNKIKEKDGGGGEGTHRIRNNWKRNPDYPQPQSLLKGSPEIYVDIISKFRASTCMNMNAHAEPLHASVKQQKGPNRPYSCLIATHYGKPENKPSMLD